MAEAARSGREPRDMHSPCGPVCPVCSQERPPAALSRQRLVALRPGSATRTHRTPCRVCPVRADRAQLICEHSCWTFLDHGGISNSRAAPRRGCSPLEIHLQTSFLQLHSPQKKTDLLVLEIQTTVTGKVTRSQTENSPNVFGSL